MKIYKAHYAMKEMNKLMIDFLQMPQGDIIMRNNQFIKIGKS